LSVPLIRHPVLELPGVAHGFTTRAGGVSLGGLDSLNLGRRPDERPEHLAENWRRVAAALDRRWSAAEVALVQQVHGAEVAVASRGTGPDGALTDADAVIADEPGVIVAVRVADCVPILVASPSGVAAIHAGWRGTAGGVVAAAIAALVELTGDRPEQMAAAIGPHISAAVYEVGDEVVRAIAATGVPETAFVRPGARPHVDLGAAVAHQLAAAGLTRVGSVGLCTVGDPRFFSHRRDGAATGRSAAVIARVG
jgi:YfiH family protein